MKLSEIDLFMGYREEKVRRVNPLRVINDNNVYQERKLLKKLIDKVENHYRKDCNIRYNDEEITIEEDFRFSSGILSENYKTVRRVLESMFSEVSYD